MAMKIVTVISQISGCSDPQKKVIINYHGYSYISMDN